MTTYVSCSNGFSCCFFASRRRHTRYWRDWSSDVCSSDLGGQVGGYPGGDRGDGRDRDQGPLLDLQHCAGAVQLAALGDSPADERAAGHRLERGLDGGDVGLELIVVGGDRLGDVELVLAVLQGQQR